MVISTNTIKNATNTELHNLLEIVQKEVEQRKKSREAELWENVQTALEAYLAEFDYIKVMRCDPDREIIIRNKYNDLSVNGYIYDIT